MSNAVLTVADVFNDVGRVLGTADSATIYSRINDIVEILATESDWDPTRGYLDVWVNCDGQITLPPEVDVVLAVNIFGRPTQIHDFWFQFHLNGPGEHFRETSNWGWWANRNQTSHSFDGLTVPVFQDPPLSGVSLVATLEAPQDSGTPMRVYGYDTSGNWIRSIENNIPVDGFLVPTVFGNPMANPSAPQIATISRVSFENVMRVGYISLWGVNANGVQTQLGSYRPYEVEPRYRRIQLAESCGWARIAFKKRIQPLAQLTDLIFLHSRYSIITEAKALQKIDEDRIQEAEMYHQKAVNFLIKKQKSVSVPSGPSIQIADNNLIAGRVDRMN